MPQQGQHPSGDGHRPDPECPNVAVKSEDDGSQTKSTQTNAHSDADVDSPKLWRYPHVPLPSELLNAYQPPAHLFSVDSPVADPSSFHGQLEYANSRDVNAARDLYFAARANELINKVLDRTPIGTSVVDPDSVLGESGRLYHGYKDGKYLIPNDAAEQDRLDLQHEVFQRLFDGWLALGTFTVLMDVKILIDRTAPLPSPPKYVLDVGTGTGLWAREFAEQNPSSYVIGSDLSSIQPETSLPNLAWSKDDAEDPWLFPLPRSHLTEDYLRDQASQVHKISFDYIHLRLVFSCFNDPQAVIRQGYENLVPGGWLEFQDLCPTVHQANPSFEGDAVIQWLKKACNGALKFGRDVYVAEHYKRWLEEAGFVDLKETRFVLPCHQWMDDPKLKEVGRYNQQNFMQAIPGGGFKALRGAGMTPEEIEVLSIKAKTELRIRRNHIYQHAYVVYGRKPFPREAGSFTA